MTNIQAFIQSHAGQTGTFEVSMNHSSRIRIGLDLGKIQCLEMNFNRSIFNISHINTFGEFFVSAIAPRYIVDKHNLFATTTEILRDQIHHLILAIQKTDAENQKFQAMHFEINLFLQDLKEADSFLEEKEQANLHSFA